MWARSSSVIVAALAALAAGCAYLGCAYHGRAIDDAAPGDEDARAAVDGPPGQPDAPADAAPPPPDAQVDARPCPAAPSGCVAFSCGTPSCYYVCNPDSWGDAQDRCQIAGLGCLATIDDAIENACITAHTNPAFPNLVWFGFAQAPGSPEPGGGWGWACGSSGFAAPNWGMFEPNDEGGGEDCAAMNAGAVWIDGDCDTSLRYVCEIVP